MLLTLLPVVAAGQSYGDSITVREVRVPVRVEVEEVGEAAVLMQSMPAGDPERLVTVYRVEIFSDNTALARERAYEAYAKFRALCPEVATNERRDINYSSPKYTVRVGAFLTHEEAQALCGRLRGAFEAYIRTDRMPLSTFAN